MGEYTIQTCLMRALIHPRTVAGFYVKGISEINKGRIGRRESDDMGAIKGGSHLTLTKASTLHPPKLLPHPGFPELIVR